MSREHTMTPTLHLGARHTLDARTPLGDYRLPAHDLLTHGVIVGMTGSGKTGPSHRARRRGALALACRCSSST
jgi:hypothetical protein